MAKIKNMDVEWDYSDKRGPENWHTLCDWFAEGAKFPYQSPIALSHELSHADNENYEAMTIHYQKELFTEKEFKNTIHFVPFDTKSFVLFNGIEYHLTDIHFHMPSEHVIENQRQPLEFHLVHMNQAGENLVLGVLFELTKGGPILYKLSEDIWNFAHHIQEFNPQIFLPEKRSHFHYVGSLTTPPTKGPINWFVFDTIGTMKLEFIDLFREEMMENNARPLQDLKERKIIYYGG